MQLLQVSIFPVLEKPDFGQIYALLVLPVSVVDNLMLRSRRHCYAISRPAFSISSARLLLPAPSNVFLRLLIKLPLPCNLLATVTACLLPQEAC